jgi:hypothetical protein
MADRQWPVLSREAAIEGYRVHGPDPTERSATQDGLGLDRPGCAEMVDWIDFDLRYLSAADYQMLDTFQKETVKIGGYPFTFWERVHQRAYQVRLRARMEFALEGGGVTWRTHVALKEESP